MSNSKMDRKRKLEEKHYPKLIGKKKVRVGYQFKLKENQRPSYPELDHTTKTKLNEFLAKAHTKVSIDYSKQEILDIQTAVHTMLERVVTRANQREMFQISRIEPCGSMSEQTAVWKYSEWTGERYTEFDFLAVMGCSPEIVRCNHDCGQCVAVGRESVHANILFGEPPSRLIRCDRLFKLELNTCLGSSCDCFSVHNNGSVIDSSYSYKLAEECKPDYRCDKCVVEMPTGILRVGRGPKYNHCSLAFRWTSKAKTLSVYDRMLIGEAMKISTLSIHVDFLPALEVPAATTDAAGFKLFVSKHCDVCGNDKRWRISNCKADIAYIVNEMSEKHRQCYKIIKYLLSRFIDENSHSLAFLLNWYYVKTVALNHSRECSDLSEGCAECVLKMLTELKHGCETEMISSFHEPDVNIVRPCEPGINKRICDDSVNKLIDFLVEIFK